jgi:serine/threonine protein kinase
MVTQFHGVNGKCVTLTNAHKTPMWTELTQLARIFIDISEALKYVHDKGFLHNDIKGDNVIITGTQILNFHPVLIDFGKCRRIEDAKQYSLNKQEQKHHRNRYWHIAPELVSGTHKQSYKSDVYSFGVMMKSVSIATKYRHLKYISGECMNESPSNRPMLTCLQDKLSKLMKMYNN